MVNTKLLQSKMILEGFTQRKLAKEAKIGLNVLNKKINNNGVFRCDEVDRICEVLHITDVQEKFEIFFAQSVPKMEQEGE